MQQKQLEILVTNDDSYLSKGINLIAAFLTKYGNVTVVAPKEPQSGMSTALTLEKPLRLHKISGQTQENGNQLNIYALTGTPVDCVKMAMNKFYQYRKPDILVSGINHGSNAATAAVYSGTLGAAIEGTIYGIPSVGLSLDSHLPDADFSQVETFIGPIIDNFLACPPVPGVFLNINFPNISADKIKGVKFAKQGAGMWIKEFTLCVDPHGREYYWMTGEFLDLEQNTLGDHKLLEEGYITIVPHNVDTTNYPELERLSNTWKL